MILNLNFSNPYELRIEYECTNNSDNLEAEKLKNHSDVHQSGFLKV